VLRGYGQNHSAQVPAGSRAKYWVDRVLNVKRAASLRAGGQGIRYVCKIIIEDGDNLCHSRTIALFHDSDYWFIELEDDGWMSDYVV